MKELYCDHNATSPLRPAAAAAMTAWSGVPANPSGQHTWGARAADALAQAREQVATLIGAASREVVFTSGATEANNIALKTLRDARPDAVVACSEAEHPAVREIVLAAPRHMILSVTSDGAVDLDALEGALRHHRGAVVSVMAANNETGVLSEMRTISAMVRRHGALLHCDATQAVGRVRVDVEEWGVDLLSLSAHKFGGPIGTGVLFVSRAAHLNPPQLMRGGSQERRWRPGTVNVPGAVGTGVAAVEVLQAMSGEQAIARMCRDDLEDTLRLNVPEIRFNSVAKSRLPGVSSVTVPGRPAQALLLAMPTVAASEGSACASGTLQPSYVLQAMGLSPDDAASTLRFSFGPANDAGDGHLAAQALLSAIDRVDRALTMHKRSSTEVPV